MSGASKGLSRTKLIGFGALAVCAVGYVGMGLALVAGKLGYMAMVHAGILAAALGIIGEVGLWVGAGCLGLSLFKKRAALFNRVFGRDKAESKV